MKEKLFCYGTLKDPLIQEKLFGHTPKMKEAILEDWAIYQSDIDYLFIKPDKNNRVNGYIIELYIDELFKADQWEEIPFYLREKLPAVTENGTIEEVWVYTRREAEGIPFNKGKIAKIEHEEIIREIETLNAQTSVSHLPFCDMYILFSCEYINKETPFNNPYENLHPNDTFLKESDQTAQLNLPEASSKNFKCSHFEEIKIIGNTGYEKGSEIEIGRQKIRTYLSMNLETEFVTVTLTIPACSISPTHLLEQLTGKNLRLIPENGEEIITVQNWLEHHSLFLTGKPRAALILSKEPDMKDLYTLLGDKEIKASKNDNIYRNGNNMFFVSERCVVEIADPFLKTFELRIPDATVTLLNMTFKQDHRDKGTRG